MLESSADYLAEESPDAARRLILLAIDAGAQLADMPHLGRSVPELPGLGLRERIVGRYQMMYRASAGEVQVIAFVHGAQDLAGAVNDD